MTDQECQDALRQIGKHCRTQGDHTIWTGAIVPPDTPVLFYDGGTRSVRKLVWMMNHTDYIRGTVRRTCKAEQCIARDHLAIRDAPEALRDCSKVIASIKDAGYTDEEIAAALSVTTRTIARWKNGVAAPQAAHSEALERFDLMIHTYG